MSLTHLVCLLSLLCLIEARSLLKSKQRAPADSKVFVLLRTTMPYDQTQGVGFVQAVKGGLTSAAKSGKVKVDRIEAVNLSGAMTAKLGVSINDKVSCTQVEKFARNAVKQNMALHSAIITCRNEKPKRILRGKI
ncbi:unnamed protein product, partial [Mesorhabditis belari]|uniref:Uncharacterized protein n=1 Tax=Mesorhabditis belari TaxID=2138241 RepID=A0AAF3J408_9BILA